MIERVGELTYEQWVELEAGESELAEPHVGADEIVAVQEPEQ